MDYFPAPSTNNSSEGSASSSNEDPGNCMEMLLDKVKKAVHPQPPKEVTRRTKNNNNNNKRKTTEEALPKKEESSVGESVVAQLLMEKESSLASLPSLAASASDTPTNSRSSVSEHENTVEKRYEELRISIDNHKKIIDFQLEQTLDDVKSIVTMLTDQTKQRYLNLVRKEINVFVEDVREIERENSKKRQKK